MDLLLIFLGKQDKFVVARAQTLWWKYQVPWKCWHFIRNNLQVPRPKVRQEWVEVQASHRSGVIRHYYQPIHTGVWETQSFEWHYDPRVCTWINEQKFWNSNELGGLCTCCTWKMQWSTNYEESCEENKIHLQPILLRQAFNVTQHAIESSLKEILKSMTLSMIRKLVI